MAVLGGDYTRESLGNLWYLSSDPNLATFVGGTFYPPLRCCNAGVLVRPCRTSAGQQG